MRAAVYHQTLGLRDGRVCCTANWYGGSCWELLRIADLFGLGVTGGDTGLLREQILKESVVELRKWAIKLSLELPVGRENYPV